MSLQRKNLIWFSFLICYVAFYYLWLLIWKFDDSMLTLGGNLFSILGGAIATCWLLLAAQRNSNTDKPFWFLLAAGTYNFFLAEFLWLTYENLLHTEVPFPGLPDFFFLLQIVFYLAAFIYKVIKEKQQLDFIKFIFDILIVMTVAFTFSWHFLLQPFIAVSEVSTVSLAVTLAYPIGDLALLFGVGVLFLGMQQAGFNKTIFFLFMGWFIQIIADSAFLYFVARDDYSSGSWSDPLFSLAILLVGYAGLAERENATENLTLPIQKSSNRALTIFRIVFPYFNVTILFILMISRSNGVDALTIGSGLSILLIVIRQIFVLTENQKLLYQVYDKKENPEFHHSETRLQFLAYHDSLTGLANRALFEEMLAKAVSEAKIYGNSFAVMFLDLDNFKTINDTMGHDAGDRLLVSIAERLKESTRKNDVVARLGGDEFTLLIRDISAPQNAAVIAEKILRSLSLPHTVDGKKIISSPSIGIALYPLNGTTPAALLKKADMAMYQVKDNGKGNYQLFEEDSLVTAKRKQ